MAAWLREVLFEHWGIPDADTRALPGGMNSATWLVRDQADRWVAKLVPNAHRHSLLAGLRLAATVQAAGIPAGAPRPTVEGVTVLPTPHGVLALLEWVDGDPLTAGDQPLIGETLGRAHVALAGVDAAGLGSWHWLDPDAAHLDVQGWVRPAVRAVVEEHEAVLPRLRTWGGLHGDPAPEAFLRSRVDGRCGLIDWASGLYGPLLYDLASAVMYVGGLEQAEALVASYRAHALVDDGELAACLAPLLRFRWAVQADYFARRITDGDLTGIPDAGENLVGLDDARRHLTADSPG